MEGKIMIYGYVRVSTKTQAKDGNSAGSTGERIEGSRRNGDFCRCLYGNKGTPPRTG